MSGSILLLLIVILGFAPIVYRIHKRLDRLEKALQEQSKER
ncbi:hypothetical protein [Paenibacillus aquistagni]|nr:hypothetical protein [Paenibacillus aquistagni]